MDLDNLSPISEPTNPNDKVCAPDKIFENGSCYTLHSLVFLAYLMLNLLL